MQTKSKSNLKVIDVSHHQNSIDWAKVAASGVVGAFIKATEGRTSIDAKFSSHATGSVAAGLKIGFYHYARPENNSPEEEAANFYKAVKGFKSDFPHVLDIEGDAPAALGREKLTAWCVAWLKEVERLSGHATMLYTGASFAKNYLSKALGAWPLWVAHYDVNTPMSNSTWDTWAVFQYTSKGKVDGISGNVDVNAMEAAFFKPPITTTPAAPASKLSKDDAKKIISLLSASYELTTDKEARAEIHRLADELRKASGLTL